VSVSAARRGVRSRRICILRRDEELAGRTPCGCERARGAGDCVGGG
jgi:hypothetical protein